MNYIVSLFILVRTQSLDRTFEAPSPPPLTSAVELDWILSPDEDQNMNTREEFRFEQVFFSLFSHVIHYFFFFTC